MNERFEIYGKITAKRYPLSVDQTEIAEDLNELGDWGFDPVVLYDPKEQVWSIADRMDVAREEQA